MTQASGRRSFPAVLLAVLIILISQTLPAQNNEWAWMGGSNQSNAPGIYGTVRIPASSNLPGARNGSATWVDSQGNFWSLGGFGYDSAGVLGYLNDLWEFSPTNNEWTWMAGGSNDNQAGVYGTLLTPAPANTPGSRMQAASWTDSKGHLWLFGGSGADSGGNYGDLNDLWEFDPSASQWTWMGGSSTIPSAAHGSPGAYGTQGTPAASNLPGSRTGAATWTDSQGNLWLFGGAGFDSAGKSGELNDLWEYSPGTNEWTWIGGSDTVGQLGAYGTLGTPAAANIPGARDSAATWTDPSGNFWLFGGESTVSGPTGNYLNDLWRFSPSTGQWTWMAGSSTGSFGTYGEWMTPASGDSPGSRYGAVGWTDSSGNLWLFGGRGYSSSNLFGNLNDYWEYNPSINQWAWIGGSSTVVEAGSAFGDLGAFSLSNVPGSRDGASAWSDKNGNQWLFGGEFREANGNQGELSDVWEFQTAAAGLPSSEPPVITPSSGPLAASATVSISDGTPGATIYFSENGAMPPTQYIGPFPLSSAQTVNVVAIAVASGYATSQPSSAQFTVPFASSPGFSPAPGTYSSSQSVTITDATPGATIFFTTDGSTPTTSSTQYSAPITISNSETIQAIAVANGYANSAPAGAVYTIWPASAINEWAWMNGPNSPSNPVWGTLGVPAIGNLPGRRYHAAQWTDAQGNLWLFGGFGYGNSPSQLYVDRNDLWEFSPNTDEWAWMGGSNDSGVPNQGGMPGVYGNLGTASAANIPGGREGPSSWTDSNGNFWLFGGGGFDSAGTYGELNDLWMFQPKTNEWTWVTGSNVIKNCFQANTYTYCAGQSGVYGTQNTAAPDNTPGARESVAEWYDNAGNLWLFGGIGIDPVNVVNYYFNDLWKFSLSTKQWTWVSGNSTFSSKVACQFDPNSSLINDCGYPGTYGTLGTPSPTNMPGARRGASTWIDGSGNLWLFGGEGFDSVGNINPMNDLWEFTPSNAQWTWKGGDNTVAPCLADWSDTCSVFILPGTFGTQGTPAVGNIPGYTSEAAAWTDKAGNFWLFSGAEASYSPGEWPAGGWNNLWVYSPTANEWTWMTGTQPTTSSPPSSAPSYGELGVPAASNMPPTTTGAASWTDQNGNFWLFGGAGGDDYSNVTWELKPLAPTPTTSFAITISSNQVNVTQAASATSAVGLVIGGGFNSAVALTASGQPSGVTVSFSPSSITGTQSSQMTIAASSAAAIGTYTITVTGTSGSTAVTATFTLVVAAPPPSFSLTSSTSTLIVNSGSQGSLTFTVTPRNGFNSAVAFGCSGLPTGATCSFNPSIVTPSGVAATTQLTIAVTASASAARPARNPWLPAAGLSLAGCVFLFGRRKALRLTILPLVVFATLSLLTACGGSSGANGGGGAQSTSQTVTITASSGTLQQSTNITLTVN